MSAFSRQVAITPSKVLGSSLSVALPSKTKEVSVTVVNSTRNGFSVVVIIQKSFSPPLGFLSTISASDPLNFNAFAIVCASPLVNGACAFQNLDVL